MVTLPNTTQKYSTAAICYTVYLLYVGLPTFMNIDPDEGFLFSSSVLAVGLVVLVAFMASIGQADAASIAKE